MMTEQEIKDLEEWFNNQSDWFVYGINLLLKKGNLSQVKIHDIASICLGEKSIDKYIVDISSILKGYNNHSLHINSLNNVTNVYGLAPRKILDFGDKNLTIVYGQNGSGKSSYVRLLKNICNSRTKEKIIGNVYKNKDDLESAKAIISYKFDDQEKTYEWDGSQISNDLSFVDVFDAKYGDVFLKNASEISYEPPILGFFSRIIEMLESLSKEINEKKNEIRETLIVAPLVYEDTEENKWYKSINASTTDEELNDRCSFTQEDEKKLGEYRQRLDALKSGTEKQKISKKIIRLSYLTDKIKNLAKTLCVQQYKEIEALREDVETKKKVAMAVAESISTCGELEGVGQNEWKFLWDAAKKYSETLAYKKQSFPYLGNAARCVLCHQVLDDVAIKRLQKFDEYIKGTAESALNQAKSILDKKIENLSEIPENQSLDAELDALDMPDNVLKEDYLKVINEFRIVKNKIIKNEIVETDVETKNLVEALQLLERRFQEQQSQLKEDSEKDNGNDLVKIIKELEMKKFLKENKERIKENVAKKRIRTSYDKVMRMFNTRNITTKKAELSEKLITENFAKRFELELKEMGVNLKVSFEKKSVTKGVIKHSIVLTSNTDGVSPTDVLSEGECRIVSIAAFFADVLEREGSIPFVFDDPISSLDIDYEEAVERRLLNLAESRQIIVFTHRLSFMCGLLELAKNKETLVDNINEICIKREFWGAGEPSSIPINVEKPDKTINRMMSEEIPKIKKIFEEEGSENYYYRAKALASDFRILVERVVEYILVGDVVQRFRRSINTLGKLDTLAKVTKDDCAVIDKMMTKYSCYEHSQSQETPVSLPKPDEFNHDMKELSDWIKEFKNRK